MPAYISLDSSKRSEQPPQPAGPVEVGIVFDRSASMNPIRKAAVEGFNVILEEQRRLKVPTRISLMFFGSEITEVHNGA